MYDFCITMLIKKKFVLTNMGAAWVYKMFLWYLQASFYYDLSILFIFL